MTSAFEKAQLANRDLTGNFSLKKVCTGQISSIDDNSLEGRMGKRIVDSTNCGAINGLPVGFDIIANKCPESRMFRRDLAATGNASDLIYSKIETPFIDALRLRAVLPSLGATIYTGLTENFSQPVLANAPVATISSGEAVLYSVDTNASFATLSLLPQRIGCELKVSKNFLKQTADRDAETWLAGQLMKSIAQLCDQVAITGSTAGYQTIPGLLGNTNLSSNTWAGSVTWANVQAAIKTVEGQNPPLGPRGWILTPSAVAKLAQAPVISGFSMFIYDSDNATVSGHKVGMTGSISGNNSVFGYMPDVAMCFWADALDIMVDPISMASSNWLVLYVSVRFNSAPLRNTLIVSTDTAAA